MPKGKRDFESTGPTDKNGLLTTVNARGPLPESNMRFRCQISTERVEKAMQVCDLAQKRLYKAMGRKGVIIIVEPAVKQSAGYTLYTCELYLGKSNFELSKKFVEEVEKIDFTELTEKVEEKYEDIID